MFHLIYQFKYTISGIFLGAMGGLVYWKYVGCITGTCPITSHWQSSTLYGALMGAMIFTMFLPDKTKAQEITFEEVTPSEFKEKMKDKKTVILDVRTPAEYKQKHIPKAVNIDIYASDFKDRVAQLDPQFTYLVYCRSGARSSNACGLMSKVGLKKVFNLKGGILQWDGATVSNK